MSTLPAADPIPMPGVFRAQVALQGRSGLPEDRYVNVFHFRDQTMEGDFIGDDRRSVVADTINGKVQSFYRNTTPGGAQYPISNYLSRLALSITRAVQVRVYHLGEPEPREPVIFDWFLNTVSPDPTAVMPNEVAACLSVYGDRNIPGRRGRNYVGPLGANAVAEDPVRGDLKVADALRNTMVDAALRLATPANNVVWGIYSPTYGRFHPVTNGWVDDALDTQRRRGVRPTGRLAFAFTQSNL